MIITMPYAILTLIGVYFSSFIFVKEKVSRRFEEMVTWVGMLLITGYTMWAVAHAKYLL
jgi:hypothetical protein